MKKLEFVMVIAALLAAALGGCDFLMGPDEPAGNTGGNLVISFGQGGGRAITSGADLPGEVLDSMSYELTLTGPGGEVLTRTVASGENLRLSVALGVWRIDARAYNGDGLAGTKSVSITVVPGVNTLSVPMTINGGYFSVAVDPVITNGTVKPSFEDAFPETTITLAVEPDAGYVLKSGSLRYSDGSGDHAIGGYSFAMPASDVTVSAEFELLPPDTYTITAAALSNGAVSANQTSAPAGASVTVTVEPDDGYILKSGTLKYSYSDGGGDHAIAISGPEYTFTMPASDVTINAEFELPPPDTYKVSVDTLSGGKITVDAEKLYAAAGAVIALAVEPDADYVLKTGSLKYSYGGTDYPITGDGPGYSFEMPASDVTISAEFELITYSVAIAPLSGGAVAAEQDSAPRGAVISLAVEPDADYALKEGSLKYSYGGADYPITGIGPGYSFEMPASDVTISAEFELIMYSVAIAPLSDGAVAAEQDSAPRGAVISVAVNPDPGFALKEGSLKYSYGGADYPIAGIGPGYSFEMPASDVTISAFFNKTLGITIEGPQEETIAITALHSTGSTSTDISWTADEWVELTLESSGYSKEDGNLKWIVNGIEISTASGNSLTIRARDYVQQSYMVTVMIKENGEWYSTEIPFKVTE
jgi:hypothetical protein